MVTWKQFLGIIAIIVATLALSCLFVAQGVAELAAGNSLGGVCFIALAFWNYRSVLRLITQTVNVFTNPK